MALHIHKCRNIQYSVPSVYRTVDVFLFRNVDILLLRRIHAVEMVDTPNITYTCTLPAQFTNIQFNHRAFCNLTARHMVLNGRTMGNMATTPQHFLHYIPRTFSHTSDMHAIHADA